MIAIEFNGVWKKFKRGEKFNSLRDAIPNLFKSVTSSNGLGEKEFWAVKDVSFSIGKGEVVGIMGPNGAGKSTILKLLSRIIVPNKGSMAINGRLSALIEVTAGFHPELTGRENVYLNGTILGMKKKEIDEKFEEIVDFSGVREFIDTPVKRYSSGMYSRLGFSVAAHMDPEVLLVDEVLAVGDMAFRAKCAQKMRELLKSGCTIALVSHQLSLIQSLCKRVILLHQGEVIKDGPTEEVIPHYQNIVYRKSDEDFKRKLQVMDDKVRVSDESKAKITSVVFKNDRGEAKENFLPGEDITIEAGYQTTEKIESPLLYLEIVRSDGVVCCASRSDEVKLNLPYLNKEGLFKIHLGRIELATGIYLAKVSIWDKDLIHPFAMRTKDVFRMETKKGNIHSNIIFTPKIEWSVDAR